MNSIGDEVRSKDCHEGWLMSCDPPHKGSEITPKLDDRAALLFWLHTARSIITT